MSRDPLRVRIDQLRAASDATIAGGVLLELLDKHDIPAIAKARVAALEALGDAIAPYPGGKADPYGDAFRAFVGVLIRDHPDLLPKMTREVAPGHFVGTAPPAGWQARFVADVLERVAACGPAVAGLGGDKKYMPADWFDREHGIKPQRLSVAARDGKVRTADAPPHMRTATGAGPRVLYHVDDAIKHCAPQRTKRRTTDALRAMGDAIRGENPQV